MPKKWDVQKKDQPNQIFSCSGIALSYTVASKFMKTVKNILDNNAGYKMSKFQEITCVDELKLRKYMHNSYNGGKLSHQLAAKMMRFAFHDSVDYKNIMSADKLDDKVDASAPQGLDFCLHTSYVSSKKDPFDENPDGEPDHNRGMKKQQENIEKVHKLFPKWQRADIEALFAVMAICKFGGPQVPYKLGRMDGDCNRVFCSGKGCKNSQDYFLIESPHPRIRDPAKNLNFFKAAGFTLDEAVALMGAHSIGGVNVCTGNGNPGNHAWCKDAPKIPTHRLSRKQTYFDSTPDKLDNQYFKQLNDYYADDTPTCTQIGPQTQKKSWKGLIVREAQQEKYCEQPVYDAGGKIRFTDKYSWAYKIYFGFIFLKI